MDFGQDVPAPHRVTDSPVEDDTCSRVDRRVLDETPGTDTEGGGPDGSGFDGRDEAGTIGRDHLAVRRARQAVGLAELGSQAIGLIIISVGSPAPAISTKLGFNPLIPTKRS